LPAYAHDADVDRASHHRGRTLFRHAAARLVLDCGRGRAASLLQRAMVHGNVARAIDPVRLHLGAAASHARRYPPSDLGPRLWLRPERARMAHGGNAIGIGRAHAPGVVHRLSRDGWNLMMNAPAKNLRTPFRRISHLGAARTGTQHFWHQRLTAVADI